MEPLELEVLPPRAPKLKNANTLYNVFQEWLDSLSVSNYSRWKYQLCLEKFEVFIAGKKLNQNSWHAYQRHLVDEGLSPHHLKKLVGVPRRAFKWAKNRGYLRGDWWVEKTVQLPPIQYTKKEIFTREEYERMKVSCTGQTANQKYQLIVMCYSTGMSPVDVCRMKWESVDFERQEIRLFRSKMATRSGRECKIPINTDTDIYKLLLQQREFCNSDEAKELSHARQGYVFPELARIRGYGHTVGVGHVDPAGQNNLWQMMKHVIKTADIKGKKTLKSFRNTFCSDLINSGVDLITVCQMTGHSNPKQLAEYVTVDSKVLHAAMDKRNAYAAGLAGPRP